MKIAQTPEPPYYAVIFTTQRTGEGQALYEEMNERLGKMVGGFPGYLGMESSGTGITISYWESEEAILAWKKEAYHAQAIKKGISTFYSDIMTRVCKVERDHRISRKKPK